jgi:lambda family phage portal protein
MMGGIASALRSLRPSAVASGLESGRMARRLAGFVPSRAHVNTLIQQSGETTLARARYLIRNNGYAANALECFASNLVGAGIVPRWIPPAGLSSDGADLKKEVQSLWVEWTDEADAEGLTDFYGLTRRVARELFTAGECFVRRRPRFLTDGLSVPLQLQLLPSEMLDLGYMEDLSNGSRIRQGIEFDRIGRRVAYHFWSVHPGDSTERMTLRQRVRVPASEVLHILDPLEGGQVRGLSRMTSAIVPLWVLDAYDDAELERKKTAALFVGFITRQDADGELFDKAAEEKAAAGDGNAAVTLEPGRMHVLLPGEDPKFSQPADVGPNFEAFQYRALARICAALGLPYAGVTGDLVRANYANQRAALIEARRRLEALQHGVIVYQLCRPVWAWFMEAATLADAVSLPGYADDPKLFRKVRWIPPRWEWVDPFKDRKAEEIAVDMRAKPLSMVIEQEGYDPDEVFEQIAAEQKKMRDLGIAPPVARPVPAPSEGRSQTGDDTSVDRENPDEQS